MEEGNPVSRKGPTARAPFSKHFLNTVRCKQIWGFYGSQNRMRSRIRDLRTKYYSQIQARESAFCTRRPSCIFADKRPVFKDLFLTTLYLQVKVRFPHPLKGLLISKGSQGTTREAREPIIAERIPNGGRDWTT